MFPLSLPRIFGTVHCDSDAPTSRAASTINTVKSAISVPESELKRWRRSFDANAQTVVEGPLTRECRMRQLSRLLQVTNSRTPLHRVRYFVFTIGAYTLIGVRHPSDSNLFRVRVRLRLS